MKKISLFIISLLISVSLTYAQQKKDEKKKDTKSKPAAVKKDTKKKDTKSKPASSKKPSSSKPAPSKAAPQAKKPMVNNFPKREFKRFSISALAGYTVVFSDLERFAGNITYGAALNYKFTHSLGIRIGYMQGNFSRGKSIATDTIVVDNNFSEISAVLVFNIGNINFIRPNRPLQLYTFVGIAQLSSDASVYNKRQLPTPVPFKSKKSIYALPVGLGIKFKISNSFDLMAEAGLRITQSDSFDLWNPTGVNIGNKSYDMYAFPSVGLTYHIGRQKYTPIEWHNPVRYIYDELASMKKTVEALKIDNDNDGVSDYFDREANTPDSVNVYGNGKAVDTDRDGIPDHQDAEIATDKGAQVDANGKSIDTDNDGVPDHKDLEPNTDTTMLANHQGIAIVSKSMAQQLKDIPESKQEKMFKEVGKVGYLPAIFFETDQFDVPSKHYADLYGVAHALRNYPETKIYIIGGADMRKDEAYNLELARKRAQAVADLLSKKFGIDRSRLIVQTIGKKDPLVDGKRKDALAANRRVTFRVVE